MNASKQLLAIVELGGYPDFTPLYKSQGYQVTLLHNTRKAMAFLKQQLPDVIVAEFNYQSNFRDRTSTLESVLATVERLQQSSHKSVKVIVFYDREYESQLQKLQAAFDNFDVIPYPVMEEQLAKRLGESA
jgi:hypothetical protein